MPERVIILLLGGEPQYVFSCRNEAHAKRIATELGMELRYVPLDACCEDFRREGN